MKNYLKKFYRSFSMLAMIWVVVTAVTGRYISRYSALGVIVAALIVAAMPEDWFDKIAHLIQK
ncbi:MAG: Phage protein [Lactococcus sp.]